MTTKTSLILATLTLLMVAFVALSGCSTSAVGSKAVEMRAANEYDCHLNNIVVVPVEDKEGIWRATGCGHEEFWTCREDRFGGPDLCDRIDFPENTKFLRF